MMSNYKKTLRLNFLYLRLNKYFYLYLSGSITCIKYCKKVEKLGFEIDKLKKELKLD